MSSTDQQPAQVPLTRAQQQAWASPSSAIPPGARRRPNLEEAAANVSPRLGKDGSTKLPKNPAHDILHVI